MSPRLVLITLTAALAMAAPAFAINNAADDAADAKRLAAARANTAAPVETVKFLRAIDSYEVVGKHEILVWETNTKAWLVDLRPSAACRDLDHGFAVSIDSLHDTMNTTNSYVVGDNNLRCKIIGIREVDVPAMRAAERAPEAAAKASEEVASAD